MSLKVSIKSTNVPVYSGRQIGVKAVNAISVMYKNLNKAEKQKATKIIQKYLVQFNP
jgi:uncharacterized protein (DUF4213/DUF364 family)